jgi:hypothetical protein
MEPGPTLAPFLWELKMSRNKRKEVENFCLVYEEKYGHLPIRDIVVDELKVSNATADTVMVPLRAAREKHHKESYPIQFSKAQKSHVEMAINTERKALLREFESKVQYQAKLYIERHMPHLEKNRKELSDKIAMYDKMINNHKSIFTPEEFKSILMCLHPDGERTKERYEEAFRIFKAKEDQLVKK